MRMLKIALTAVLLMGLAGTAAAQSTCLYFSEYIEGTSSNKALEIYNATEPTSPCPGSRSSCTPTAG
ncbi:MAG: hypothetical protein IPI34_11430 [bacterium]|nr:hypothetical protein [bacterium]